MPLKLMDKDRFDEGYFDTAPKENILARCKRCGNMAPSKDFKIDDELGVMVCNNCFSSSSFKRLNISRKIVEKNEEKPKSIIIHNDKGLLKNLPSEEKEEKIHEKEGDEKIKYICDKCGFSFKYNLIKNWPRTCPSCDKPVSEIKKSLF
jgi:DNA-directed RNA polymerase subunit M/transcription elongation factor TFIIS